MDCRLYGYVVGGALDQWFLPVCEIPKNAMGHEPYFTDRLLSTNEYPRRDKLKYQRALVSGGSHCLKEYGLLRRKIRSGISRW